MRILIYVPTVILDAESPDATHVRELAENLALFGNQVTIICRLKNSNYRGVATIKRLRVADVKVIGFAFSIICGLLLGIFTVAKKKYDLIYARAALTGASAYVIASLARLPCIIEVNGLMRDEVKVGWVGRWRKAAGYVMCWIESKSFHRCRHLIAVTPRIKNALVTELGLNPAKIAVIPNGANTELFIPMDTNQAKKQLNLPVFCHLIVFEGQLVAWQGVEHLIRTTPYVVKEYPATKVLIVGGGPLQEKLMRLAKGIGMNEEVIFSGQVAHLEVPLYINASDVCVAPFIKPRNEKGGLSPLKIYEYAACGKPIVASRLPGLEFIEENDTGILVEPENPQALGRAIVKLLKDPQMRKRMGENGRNYVVENHSWESVAKKVAEVCEQTLHEHRKNDTKVGNRRKP